MSGLHSFRIQPACPHSFSHIAPNTLVYNNRVAIFEFLWLISMGIPYPFLEEKNLTSLAEARKGKPNIYVFKTVSFYSPGWPPSFQLAWGWDYKWVKCLSFMLIYHPWRVTQRFPPSLPLMTQREAR